jgi:hypothetical protein
MLKLLFDRTEEPTAVRALPRGLLINPLAASSCSSAMPFVWWSRICRAGITQVRYRDGHETCWRTLLGYRQSTIGCEWILSEIEQFDRMSQQSAAMPSNRQPRSIHATHLTETTCNRLTRSLLQGWAPKAAVNSCHTTRGGRACALPGPTRGRTARPPAAR